MKPILADAAVLKGCWLVAVAEAEAEGLLMGC